MSRLSIIIPMYNESRYIARCLNSLKKQTVKNFEIILIDDWSKDNTVDIAQTYQKYFDLTILKQKNSWPGKARNRWAKESKWEILVFVDADMYFDKNYLKQLIQPIVNGKEMGTAHGKELVGNPENKLAIARCINRIPYPEKRSGVYRAIKKKVFLDSGWFDPSKWYFDDDLTKINHGKWALTVLDAICYHNNPENLREIYTHSQRVGKSLIQSWEIKNYLKKYKIWFLFLIVLLLFWIIFLSQQFWGIVLIVAIIILLLILYKTMQRAIKEKYISHLVYIPLIMIWRWSWYFVGMIRYLLIKK